MPWLISQFPELDHLEPAQRARLLEQLPWWTYPQLISRAGVGAMVIAGVLSGSLWNSLHPGQTLLLFLIIAVLIGLWFYHQQLSTLRSFMRLEIAKAFAGQRPPFCFRCGYDLRGVLGNACPECGKAVESGSDESLDSDNGTSGPS